MYYLKTECSFDSAHFLKGYVGKCSNIHGHRWRVVAEIKGERLSEEPQTRGMLVDFSDIKSALKEICDYLDHAFIIEAGSLMSKTQAALKEEGFRLIEVPFRPTAENLAMHIFGELKEKGFDVSRIEVYETPANCAVYKED